MYSENYQLMDKVGKWLPTVKFRGGKNFKCPENTHPRSPFLKQNENNHEKN